MEIQKNDAVGNRECSNQLALNGWSMIHMHIPSICQQAGIQQVCGISAILFLFPHEFAHIIIPKSHDFTATWIYSTSQKIWFPKQVVTTVGSCVDKQNQVRCLYIQTTLKWKHLSHLQVPTPLKPVHNILWNEDTSNTTPPTMKPAHNHILHGNFEPSSPHFSFCGWYL